MLNSNSNSILLRAVEPKTEGTGRSLDGSMEISSTWRGVCLGQRIQKKANAVRIIIMSEREREKSETSVPIIHEKTKRYTLFRNGGARRKWQTVRPLSLSACSSG